MKLGRRQLLQASAAAGAGLISTRKANAFDGQEIDGLATVATPRPQLSAGQTPVLTPNGSSLPFKVVDGVKVYHLVAEEVEHEFAPGFKAHCWGYNGQVHGPTIEAVEGDRVRIYLTNHLPAPTTAHWHGVLLPCGMDGVGGLTQGAIPPGETWVYEWQFRQHGTLMYHAHHDEMTQMAMGLMGMIVVHPRESLPDQEVDRDFAMLMSEWKIEPGQSRPDPNEMSDFNVLTFNARCYPGTDPLVVKTGDRVRIRFGNLSAMDHHPIHLHGHLFTLTGTDGGTVPLSARMPDSSILVPVGTTRTVEFVADNPGDWAVHCHMTHHVMNQMGHGLPNMMGLNKKALTESLQKTLPGVPILGTDGMGEHGAHVERGHMKVPDNSIPMVGQMGPYGYITMGGMFTILKVRDDWSGEQDPGWFQMPEESRSRPAKPGELKRDGVIPA